VVVAAPQWGQKAKPSAISRPQLWQAITPAVYAGVEATYAAARA
jgi:hypothetical protein